MAPDSVKVIARRKVSGTNRILGFAHDVEIEGRHTVRIDEPTAVGGTDTGPSPTRLVAAGLAGCTALTIEMYAERKGWDVGKVEVDVDVTYDTSPHISIWGEQGHDTIVGRGFNGAGDPYQGDLYLATDESPGQILRVVPT